MIVAPAAVLFPSGWHVAQRLASATLIAVALAATDGADWAYLYAMMAAAFWAGEILRRLRQWPGGAFVPGFATTAFATAMGILTFAAVAGGLLAFAAGNPTPPLPLAAFVGAGSVCALVYAERRNAGQTTAAVFALVTAVVVSDYTFGGGSGVDAAAVTGAALAVVAFRRRLGQPPPQPRQVVRTSWRQFRPSLFSFRHIFGTPRLRPSEGAILGVTGALCAQFHIDVPAGSVADGWGAKVWLVQVLVLALVVVGSLTPLILMKSAGAWLGTAWQLARGASRRALGRAFMARILLATASSFAISLALLPLHAYAGNAPVPLLPGEWPLIKELLLFYAVGLCGASWAAFVHPVRADGAPVLVGILLVVAVLDIVILATPVGGMFATLVLVALVAASAALLAFGGGRAVARIDFIAAKDP